MKTMETSIATKFKQADHVLGSNLDDAMIVTSTENESFYGMNKVASLIWSMLENPISQKEVITLLLAQYDIEPKKCEEEVTSFFDEMEKANIIQRAV